MSDPDGCGLEDYCWARAPSTWNGVCAGRGLSDAGCGCPWGLTVDSYSIATARLGK
jgi:hypothetical protein